MPLEWQTCDTGYQVLPTTDLVFHISYSQGGLPREAICKHVIHTMVSNNYVRTLNSLRATKHKIPGVFPYGFSVLCAEAEGGQWSPMV